MILDHNKRPRNFRALAGGRSAEGDNPLCGDHADRVRPRCEDGIIAEAAFQGFGCAIATASASLMTDSVKGKTVAEAEALFQRVHRLVTCAARARRSKISVRCRRWQASASFPCG